MEERSSQTMRLPDYEERKAKQEDEARSGWVQYRQEQLELRERTARLRELRLARTAGSREERTSRRG
jgi:hypothetical protein